MILIGGVAYLDPTGLVKGLAVPGVRPVVINTSEVREYHNPPDLTNPVHLAELANLSPVVESELLDTMMHEFGHRIIGLGHPNQGAGPAPLEGTDRRERLMTGGNLRGYTADLIVKKEWDQAEAWLQAEEQQGRMQP